MAGKAFGLGLSFPGNKLWSLCSSASSVKRECYCLPPLPACLTGGYELMRVKQAKTARSFTKADTMTTTALPCKSCVCDLISQNDLSISRVFSFLLLYEK